MLTNNQIVNDYDISKKNIHDTSTLYQYSTNTFNKLIQSHNILVDIKQHKQSYMDNNESDKYTYIINNKIYDIDKLNRELLHVQKIISYKLDNISNISCNEASQEILQTKIYNFNNNFNKIDNYFNLYLNDNEVLNNIIINNIKDYNFCFDYNYHYRLSYNDITTRILGEKYSLIFMLSAIIEKQIYGYCIKHNTKHICDKVVPIKYWPDWPFTILCYYFNSTSDDKFIIVFSWEYFNPQFIYYPNTNEIYNISYRYSNLINLSVNIHDVINILNNNKMYIEKPINSSKIQYCLGITPNVGHYFWNELCGLLHVIDLNLINNIDEFLIEENDYLNFAEILKTKFNKKIIYRKTQNNQNDIKNENDIIIVSKKFINKSIIKLFKQLYDIHDIINNSELNIMFDIRTNSRICINQEELIINIISVIEKYQNNNNIKINFYICGWYKFNNNNNNNNINIQLQQTMFNIIQSNFNFKINNLINYDLIDLIKISNNIDIMISNVGSGASFFYSVIYDKMNIAYTNNNNRIGFNDQNVGLNILNCKYIDSKYITDCQNNTNFKVDINYVTEICKQEILYIIHNKSCNIQETSDCLPVEVSLHTLL